jgi:hypothetical protein
MKEKRIREKTHSREYRAWSRMKTICYNTKAASYKSYGARGIRVCREWKSTFEIFLADMGAMPEDCTGIELINPQADFCKLNCRWVGPTTRRKLSEIRQLGGRRKRKAGEPYKSASITVKLEEQHLIYLKKLAGIRSQKLACRYSVNAMIRKCIEENMPYPKNMDMLGGDSK